MSYLTPLHIPNGLALDFAVEAADTAADNFLGYNSAGEITGFTSIPRARVSGGGNVTESTSGVLTITGGTAAVLTSGLTIQVKVANTSQSGYLTSTDWNTFNGKMGTALASGNIFVGNGSNIATSVSMTGDITITNAGVTAIASGVIVDADVNNSAAIALTKLAATTVSRAIVSNGSGFFTAATTTATEIGYVNGVTSPIQAQLNTKLTVTLTSPASGDFISYNGAAWVNVAAPAGSMPTGGTANQILRKIDGTNYNTQWHTLVLADVTDVTATFTEVNKLSGVTTTTTQFNYLNTATSDIQTQIGTKLTNSLAQNALFVGNASNQAGTIAPGTDGYVLMMASGVPTWAAVVGTGTVTSIDVSGGTTGLTTSGGPVTTTGTITFAGTVNATHGGTAQTSWSTGDMMYASAANTLSKLTRGSANTILGINNAGTIPEYKTVSNGLTAGSTSLILGGSITSDTTLSLDATTSRTFSIECNGGGSGISIDNGVSTASQGDVYIVGTGADGSFTFNFDGYNNQGDGAGAIFVDNRGTTLGIQYKADYSAGFTSRSLIDKGYADTHLITKLLPSAPGSGQNGQALRWNNATPAWEFFTPGGGVTNSAANTELMMSNGTNATPSGLFVSTQGSLDLGSASITGDRVIQALSSAASSSITMKSKGPAGIITLQVVDATYVAINTSTANTGWVFSISGGGTSNQIIAQTAAVDFNINTSGQGGNAADSGRIYIYTGDAGTSGNRSSGDIAFNTGAKNGSGKVGNVGFFLAAVDVLAAAGGGEKVIFIGNKTTAPASNPVGGGVLYADAGALKWKGSSGTVTTIANA